jgi:hypothetical protein
MSPRRRLQLDAEARLKADPFFADIAIILQRDGVTEKEIERRLNVQKGRGGKVGACVLVLIPIADVNFPNVPGPRQALTVSFIVLVHPTLNNGTLGTGKEPEDIADKVLALFHQCSFGYGSVLVGATNAIVPNDSFDGLVGQQVNLTTDAGNSPEAHVKWPTISASAETAPATITLACATSGASIFYTTDGSYPSSTNTAAHTYSAPFNQATAALLRVAAEKADLLPSNVRQLELA